ncbi:helix-turn-helix domain-containing protein [Nocardia sp. CA-128927]|uniref:helix-turn-helix domain-containing protein n=1 Tax=Nocardia sp. CA-128927 TaxID=3239975 RepID=UPI003D97FE29
MQVEALEKLLTKLPDSTGPTPTLPRRGIPPRARKLERRITDTDRAEIIDAYDTGSSAKQLAAQWQLAKASILTILRAAGANIRKQRRLTDEEIDHAITRYQHGESLQRIGDHLGVAHTTIRTALERRGIPRRDTHSRPHH